MTDRGFRMVFSAVLQRCGLLMTLLSGACSCASGSGGGVDDPGTCETDSDCPEGQSCFQGKCAKGTEGESEGEEPDIAVSPLALDFGSPLLGVTTPPQPVTVANTGNARLEVSSVFIEGDAAPIDYFFSKDAKPGFALDPGQDRTVEVTLVWQDDEPPVATLWFLSNDPDEMEVAVELTSEWKGDPLLCACVLEGGVDPFSDCADPTEVDWGTVAWDSDTDRDVAIYNCGDGNALLDLESAEITDEVGLGYLFEVVSVFERNDSGDEVPVKLPAEMSPGDKATLAEPLYVRVRLHGDASGLVEGEFLRFGWEEGPTDVPLRAIVACESGYVDVDGDLVCECGPIAVEVCNGADDDCDGDVDEGLLLATACDLDEEDGGDADLCPEGTTVCDTGGAIVCDDPTGESLDMCACDDPADALPDMCTDAVWVRAHRPGGGGVVSAGGALTVGTAIGIEGLGGVVTGSGGATLRSGFWYVLP